MAGELRGFAAVAMLTTTLAATPASA